MNYLSIEPKVIFLTEEEINKPLYKGEDIVKTVFTADKENSSFLQQRIFDAFLKVSLGVSIKYRSNLFIYIKTLKRIIKQKSKDNINTINAACSLNKLTFVFNENGKDEVFNPIQVTYDNSGFTFRFDERVFLLHENSVKFILIDFDLIKSFNFATYKIYEIILLNKDKKYTDVYDLNELYNILNINKDLNSYNDYRYAYRDIIKKSIAKISEVTNFEVSVQKYSGVRNKVTAISFVINKKAPTNNYHSFESISLETKLLEAGLFIESIRELINKFSERRILANYNHILNLNQKKPVDNLPNYIFVAITQNYANVIEPIYDNLVKSINSNVDANIQYEINLIDVMKLSSEFSNISIQDNDINIKKFENFLINYFPMLLPLYEKNKFRPFVVCLAFRIFENQKLYS
ncbi:MAG: hypothetical protein Q8M39_10240 [Sulfuricurvum sp.]|nr:hypothetical protein [Methylotenera sp.]MDP3095613.1 hypothetical protein [Methylotenera sp.]MDP3267192.1 hypothetical protein [Sulfuricurvum sp.]